MTQETTIFTIKQHGANSSFEEFLGSLFLHFCKLALDVTAIQPGNENLWLGRSPKTYRTRQRNWVTCVQSWDTQKLIRALGQWWAWTCGGFFGKGLSVCRFSTGGRFQTNSIDSMAIDNSHFISIQWLGGSDLERLGYSYSPKMGSQGAT